MVRQLLCSLWAKVSICVIAAFLLPVLSLSARAQQDVETAPLLVEHSDEVSVETEVVEEVKIRDPFWPVGYYPPNWFAKEGDELVEEVEIVEEVIPDEWELAQKMLVVSGMSNMGGKPMLVINDRFVQIGDEVAVELNGQTYRWRLESITDGNINLIRMTDNQE